MPHFFRSLSASLQGFITRSRKKDAKVLSDQELLLQNRQLQQNLKQTEKDRQKTFRKNQWAALKIQKAWKK